MTEREKCGDFEIYFENGWWVVENSITGEIIGRFVNKEDALDKIARYFQEDYDETVESVC
ncbi:MAG: hypothetical protein ACTSYD_05650 [Candidatus Heimdallarchaeaceae archaeon]